MTSEHTADAPDMTAATNGVLAAELVVGCDTLEPSMRFFIDQLGFELELIAPADDPAVAVVVGHGVRLRLDAERGTPGSAEGPVEGSITLRLVCDPEMVARLGSSLHAPDGTTVELVADGLHLPPPQPMFELSRFDAQAFGSGRASMGYRDLLPRRQGGRYIASHIRIAEAGPVPDYVHHHRIRLQMIYCYRGWVRVVYEDQGPSFVMAAGDCVLQPPGIRHRVLESSDGLEVVEIGCPARHDTLADPRTELPNGIDDPDREFGGQRFVRHVADGAQWLERAGGRGVVRDLGIGIATDGLALVGVIRPGATGSLALAPPDDAEFYFLFITEGRINLVDAEGERQTLSAADSVALPAGRNYRLVDPSTDFEALEVTVPATPAE